ncbi:MAG: type II secretion system protein N [Steroidobacteraceae bacterium]
MGRRTPLLLLGLGLGTFVVFTIAFLPASTVGRFLPAAIRVDRLTGTIWDGHALSLRIGQTTIDELHWRCAVLPLLIGRVRCDVDSDLGGGHFQALVTLRPGTRVSVTGLRGELPLESAGTTGAARGWRGRLRFEDVGAEVASGKPQGLSGRIIAQDLRAPDRPGTKLGSYALELGEGFSAPGVIGGRLRDLDAPLFLRGTLRIDPLTGYLAEGEVAPRPGMPAEVLDTLGFLAPPDASGRRSFSIEGSFQNPVR